MKDDVHSIYEEGRQAKINKI